MKNINPGAYFRNFTVYDQTLTGWYAVQTKLINRPKICSKESRVNNRYYLNFGGSKRLIGDINLNPNAGKNEIVNAFIVKKIHSYPKASALFGVNSLLGKFVAFNKSGFLIIAGLIDNYTVISNYPDKSNPGETGKWCCLSIHLDATSGQNKSLVWVNGKKLKEYTIRSSTGSNTMVLGDTSPNGLTPLD